MYDVAYGSHAIVAAAALILALMKVMMVPVTLRDTPNVMGEMVRGTLFRVAPLALIVALVLSVKLRRDRVLVLLSVVALAMLTAIMFAGMFFRRDTVNAVGFVYGTTGLALCARWFLVGRRAIA